ncbi:hypothetical protein GCM10023310_72090 [Paenibacillus vulneris]|uniref:Uncharacterized protein n=1 Tax=Paenibacillus vulneris TaxID=1133364 RepID=A0ABW3UEU0_9BACL
MEFLYENYTNLMIVGIVLLALVIGFGVIYAKNKNILSNDDIQNAQHILEITQGLISFFKVDPKFTQESATIFEACRKALDYVNSIMNVTEDEDKKKIAYDAVESALKQLNIEIDDHKKNMIKIGISYAIEKSKAIDI